MQRPEALVSGLRLSAASLEESVSEAAPTQPRAPPQGPTLTAMADASKPKAAHEEEYRTACVPLPRRLHSRAAPAP